MSGAKVVGIHGHTPFKDEYVKQLPQSIIELREMSKERVQKLMLSLFDGADDALFAMADKSGSNQEQASYFDAMRELRIQKRHIAKTTLRKVIASFNEVGQIEFSEDSELSASSIDDLSLVKNDELEMNVAIEGMVTRLRNVSGDRLDALQARIESAIDMQLDAKQIPCGPEVLCHGFSDGCAELDLDIKAKLVFMKLFERFVLAGMVKVYDELNNSLAQRGILPDYKRPAPKRASRTSPPASTSSSGTPVPDSSYGEHAGVNSFEGLRQLMHPNTGLLSAGMTNQASGQSYYSHEDLLGALSSYQQDLSDILPDQGGSGPNQGQLIDFRALLNSSFSQQSGSQAQTYSEVDSDVINLVSMLFEFILDDRQLQPQMKALIARLQIPILKVAIIDRNFFNKGGHPARKLLNEIAKAAVGWNPPKEGRKDRLKDMIEGIVDTVSKDFDNDVRLFEGLLADLIKFVDQEQRRGLLVEQRTKDSERGKAASEAAKKAVQDYLNEAIQDKPLPEFSVSLLRDAWSSVMVLHYLKEGPDSKPWYDACRFVEELVWSLCPDPQEPGARGKLLKLIPNLVTRFRNGLAEISYDDLHAKELMKKLEDQHVLSLQALQQQVDLSQTAVPTPTISQQEQTAAQDDVVADLVRSTMELEADFAKMTKLQEDLEPEAEPEIDDSVLVDKVKAESIQEAVNAEPLETEHEQIVLIEEQAEAPSEVPISEDDPLVKQVDAFAVGCWFEFQNQEGSAERCKLAAIIKATDKFIFVNRAGIKVAENTRLGLAAELRKGTLQVLNDGLLFDRALESIITNLRS